MDEVLQIISTLSKVVHLRLSENQHRHAHRELEAEMAEQQQIVCRLERSLKQAQFEMEKRLISQQKVCFDFC